MSTVELEEFLKPFSSALGRSTPPEIIEPIDIKNSCQFILANAMTKDEIVEKFFTEAEKIGVNIARTAPSNVAETVTKVALDMGGGKVLFAETKEAKECALEQALNKAGLEAVAWDSSRGHEEIMLAQSSDIGITFAYGGIAETGSVIQASSKESGRSICTIPTSHIAIVNKSKIFARIGDALDTLRKDFGGNMPSNVTIISGPSATADIELVRVVGVHGPVHTAIVFVED